MQKENPSLEIGEESERNQRNWEEQEGKKCEERVFLVRIMFASEIKKRRRNENTVLITFKERKSNETRRGLSSSTTES
jgi:hypothetical protein